MKYLLYILAIALLLLGGACSRHSENWATLSHADAVMEERPDSALALLQGIDSSTLNGDEEKARYALLMSMALMKEGYAVTDTSFIASALTYYQDDDGSPELMKSLYLTADILHNTGDYGGAMGMLLKAYDIAEDIGDWYWQAKTSELMGDVSSSAYANADLADYSLRAAEYYRKAGRENNRRFVLVDHAIALANLEETDKALYEIDSIFSIASSAESNRQLMTYCRRAKLSILIGCGRIDDANTLMESIPEEDLEKIMTAKDHANIARFLIHRKDLDRASCHILKSESKKSTTSDNLAIALAWADYYTAKNDIATAKVYSDSAIILQDSDVRRLVNHSTVASHRDFIRGKERLANEKAHETVVVLVVSVLFLITVITALTCVYSLRLRAEKAERLGKLKDLATMTDRFVSESERSLRLLESVAQGKSLLHDREEEIASKAKDIENMSAKMQEHLTQNRQLSEEVQKLKYAISEKDLRIRETDIEISRLMDRIEQAQGISMMRNENGERERALHREMYELYKGNWITLNLLCRRLSAGTESDRDTKLLVEDIEKEISELRSEKSIREIEERINKYNDNMAAKLRAQCAFLKPGDIKFLVFIMAGFSSHGVCVILGLTQSNFYKKRRRLLERIGSSDAVDRDAFVSAISGAI